MSTDGTTTTPDTRGELIGRLKAKLKEYVNRVKALETERDTAVTERDTAVKSAEKAKADFDAQPLKGEVDRLKGEIRTGKHRAAFDEAAKTAGAPKDALDLLWRESGWKADKDEVNPAAIGEAVKTLRGAPTSRGCSARPPRPMPSAATPPPKGRARGWARAAGSRRPRPTCATPDGATRIGTPCASRGWTWSN